MIVAKKGIELTLNKDFSISLSAGWLQDKTGGMPDFSAPRGTFDKGKVVKTNGKGDVSNFEKIKSLEKSGRPVFSKPEKMEDPRVVKIEEIFASGQITQDKAKRRAKNFALAIFKVPFIEKKYKKESKAYLEKKGFSRPGILTGYLYKSVESEFNSIDLKLKEKKRIK